MDHKDLIVWQKAILLTQVIYSLTKQFPRDEVFGLTNQIRRAVISVPSNIAEGFNRGSDKEFIYFLKVAKGSAAEVETQLIISKKLNYINDDDVKPALDLYNEIVRMLGTLIIKIEKKLERKADL
ncbi:four helix bundle protein [Allisonella histaminiformans]|uniref:four helix bundle protein n=1 Tax=Allisonella histaminiformans TaxID=209880 RepID=UPI0026F1A7CE|nr:four helix bundle protein [Allisonella histaminiformans]